MTGRVTLFLTTGMSRFFAKLGLNSRSCGLLNIVCPKICLDFLIDWGLVKPQKINLRNSKLWRIVKICIIYPYNFERKKLSIGPIFNNTFLATKLSQLSQIYCLIRKKGSKNYSWFSKAAKSSWFDVNDICVKFRFTGGGF